MNSYGKSSRDAVDALLKLTAFFSVFIVILLAAKKMLDTPTIWHTSFLSGVFALAKGQVLYQGLHLSKPLLSAIYPPMAYLAYLPVTIAGTPTLAVMIGRVFAALYFFVPFVLALKWTPRRFPPGILLSAFGVFALMVFYLLPLVETAFAVNADAPALGFGAMACVLIYSAGEEPGNARLFLAAFFAVLSVWSKQVMAPLPLALAFFLWKRYRAGICLKYLLFLLIGGSGVSGFFLAAFGAHPIFFHTLYIPSHHPWNSSNPLTAIGDAFKEFSLFAAIPLILPLAAIFINITENDEAPSLRAWLGRNHWAVFFITGLALIPLSLLGRVKVGGAHNTFSYSIYFLAISGVLALIHLHERQAKALLVTLLCVFLFIKIPSLSVFFQRMKEFYPNYASVSYAYIKNHPREAYFPCEPLSELLAEGSFLHVRAGLEERELAGVPVDRANFLETLPFSFKKVVFPPNIPPRVPASEDSVLKYLPEYKHRVDDPELPGWYVYEKS